MDFTVARHILLKTGYQDKEGVENEGIVIIMKLAIHIKNGPIKYRAVQAQVLDLPLQLIPQPQVSSLYFLIALALCLIN
ncbi:hypothetical protein L6452_25489 [Arctium lappa]|uniref:Uncharacterized protein n=1 Tax=Arctium lappa TaxID=4217 RepID=A0ACB9ACD2_ARCLA|nr:hypothetical protein L6452_25489 [Arctium lappa]